MIVKGTKGISSIK